MTAAELDRRIQALDALVPGAVRQVCERLARTGHHAVAVGGAVRDALMGREPGDWDVATSATPDQVMALFDRTIPTGIKHGTITVVMGKGRSRLAVEVTTFRGEGAYSDGRRPDSVTFGVPLHEDLARRDFVINAMAYDPVARVLIDPFGGKEDIQARRVRAVGDPVQRFTEDGLRVMRAVRFAAVLGFELEAATEAAIPGTLPILAKVSRERVRDELMKMLGASVPSRGLDIARRTGILHAILPELEFWPVPDPGQGANGPEQDQGSPEGHGRDAGVGIHAGRWLRALARVDAAGEVMVRLAALLLETLAPLPPARSEAHPLRRLKLSNSEIDRVDRLLCHGMAWTRDLGQAELRALLGVLGRDHVPDLLDLWRAEACARANEADGGESVARIRAMAERVQAIMDAGDALTTADLALSGGDIMRILGTGPGRHVGELLARLLDRVLEDPALNQPERLEDLVRELGSLT